MSLNANTVDLDTVRLDEIHDASGTCSLRAVGLGVVIIVEEAGVWVDLGGVGEGDGDVSLADGVVEDGLAVSAILVQS